MVTDVYYPDAYQDAPGACVENVTPPVFAGIATAVAQSNGSGRLTWLPATHSLNPIYYDVYAQANTATGLFNSLNKLPALENLLTVDVFELQGLIPLNEGITYHFGVRARSATGIQDSNTVSMSIVSFGVLTQSMAQAAQTLKSALTLVGGGVEGTVGDVEAVTGEVEC